MAGGLSGLRPESAAFAAGRVMMTRLRWLAAERRDGRVVWIPPEEIPEA